MKNNKMKKIISMMVAILMTCSTLMIHASATWYEYTGSDDQKYFKNYSASYGGISADPDLFVSADTYAGDPEIDYLEVGLGWTTNVSPEFPNEYRDATTSGGRGSISIDTSTYIASDYTIYGFSSFHYVEELYGVGSESMSFSTSS